jgi:uncharacterized surface protein with fasciclin (FAS1) repeats
MFSAWTLALSPAAVRAGDAKNIVETAAAAGQFNTLLTAAKAAGLADTLAKDGPFTLFAPTDEAFAKLPAGTLDALLKDTATLKSILLYHVVSGNIMAADVSKMSSAKTLQGQSVSIAAMDGVTIDGAKISQADIKASNGVIHVIDTVILPKDDILATAKKAGTFKTLLTAIEAAGLSETLSGTGPFTVFAPTDAAFAKLPKGTLESLLADPTKLKGILTYHVVGGKAMAADVAGMKDAKTVNGQSLNLDASKGVKVNDATVTRTDIVASNGVIHVIDTVLLPQ